MDDEDECRDDGERIGRKRSSTNRKTSVASERQLNRAADLSYRYYPQTDELDDSDDPSCIATRRLIASRETLQRKSRKRRQMLRDGDNTIETKNEDCTDNDSDDANGTSDSDNNNNKGAYESDTIGLRLPGGVTTAELTNRTDDIAHGVRDYLDVLFGTLAFETLRYSDALHTIPTVVSNILRYNNVFFSMVLCRKTRVVMYEPIWYDYDLSTRSLELYVNERHYNDYCLMSDDMNITWCNGQLRVDHYNPYKQVEGIGPIDQAQIRCAVACDHVAQHILHELNGRPHASDDLHDGWTRYGTTLHSMFDIEIQIRCDEDELARDRTQRQFVTLLETAHRGIGGGDSNAIVGAGRDRVSGLQLAAPLSINGADCNPNEHSPPNFTANVRMNNLIRCIGDD